MTRDQPKYAPDSKVDRLLVEVVLEDNESGVELGGVFEDLVKGSDGRLASGSSTKDLPVVGVKVGSIGKTSPDLR